MSRSQSSASRGLSMCENVGDVSFVVQTIWITTDTVHGDFPYWWDGSSFLDAAAGSAHKGGILEKMLLHCLADLTGPMWNCCLSGYHKFLPAGLAWNKSRVEAFSTLGYFCKTHEKNRVAKRIFLQRRNFKDSKIFQEKYLIAHGEGPLSTYLTRES